MSKAVREAASKGCQFVTLGEIWNAPYSNDSFGPYSEPIPFDGSKYSGDLSEKDHPSSFALSSLAKELKIWLVGGLHRRSFSGCVD